jgi:autotransporter-associated beta strand protein
MKSSPTTNTNYNPTNHNNHMKRMIQTNARCLGLTLLGALLLASGPVSAIEITQTVNQVLGQNWYATASWGDPAVVPITGNNYTIPTGLTARTPDEELPVAFPGDLLTVETGGTLQVKNGNGSALVNLVLAGGSLMHNTGFGNAVTLTNSGLAGTLLVSADSTIGGFGGAATKHIRLESNVSGSGGLTINMLPPNYLYLVGNNSGYTGNWVNTGGGIEIWSGSVNPLGSGSVTLFQPDHPLTFNATNDLVINNVIDGFGSVLKVNTNTVTLGGNNPFTGTNEVRAGVLKLGSASAISSAAVISLTGGTLDASPIGGLALNPAAVQTMNFPGGGTVIGNLTVETGTALDFNLTQTTNDILNVTGSLTLIGTPTLNLYLPGFKASGTYRLINYTGTIQGGGSFNVVKPVDSTSDFVINTSTPGQVNLVITANQRDLTWVGPDGSYWDTFALSWTNASGGVAELTTFATGDKVTFNENGAPTVLFYSQVSPFTVTVNNTINPYVFSDLGSGGGVSTSALLTKTGANSLTLISSNRFNGPINIQAGTLSVGDGVSVGYLGTPTFITNNGVFQLNQPTNGIAVAAQISGSGAVQVGGGGATLTLTGSNSYTGLTIISNGCQLNYTGTNALGTTDSGTRVLANGRLGVTANVGTISVAEPLFINGVGVSVGPGALYLAGVNNRLTYTGPVTVESDSRIRLINSPVFMTFSNTVVGNNVNLWCSAGNTATETGANITFANSLTLGASGSLTKDGPGVVNLNTLVNTWGSTTVSNGTLAANGQLDGGTVTVYGGALGGAGTVVGAVNVVTGGSIAPGNAGIGTLTLNSTVANAGAWVMQVNRTNTQNADKLVAANIPLAGSTLTVANTGPALQLGDAFDLFDGTITGPVPPINLTGAGFAAVNYVWDTSLLVSQGIISVTTNALPLLPLQITNFAKQPTNVELTWNSFPSLLYTIEYSYNLLNWAVAQANIPANGVTNSTTLILNTGVPVTSSNYTLVQYQMGTTNAQIQDATNTMAAGPLTRGLGISGTWFPEATLGYAGAPVLQVSGIDTSTSLAASFANQAWFTFDLTVGTNVTDLDLTSLSLNAARGGGATPRGFGVYVTTPTTTDELVQGALDIPTARPTWTPYAINLSGIPSLQSLTNGQVVTFKIVVYMPVAANSLEMDDITVRGNLSPGLPPPYMGADKLFLRVRRQ